MMKLGTNFGLSVVLLGSAIGVSAFAQSSTPATQTDQAPPPAASSAPSSMSPSDTATYATGKPLEMQSKEGFWGHMNPFARKKWVNRQVNPIKDQVNELDQLQSKNANDIRDVDSRSQAGIKNALIRRTPPTSMPRMPRTVPTQHSLWQATPAPAPTHWVTRSAIWISTRLSPQPQSLSRLGARPSARPASLTSIRSQPRWLVRRDTSSRFRVTAAAACRPRRRWLIQ